MCESAEWWHDSWQEMSIRIRRDCEWKACLLVNEKIFLSLSLARVRKTHQILTLTNTHSRGKIDDCRQSLMEWKWELGKCTFQPLSMTIFPAQWWRERKCVLCTIIVTSMCVSNSYFVCRVCQIIGGGSKKKKISKGLRHDTLTSVFMLSSPLSDANRKIGAKEFSSLIHVTRSEKLFFKKDQKNKRKVLLRIFYVKICEKNQNWKI